MAPPEGQRSDAIPAQPKGLGIHGVALARAEGTIQTAACPQQPSAGRPFNPGWLCQHLSQPFSMKWAFGRKESIQTKQKNAHEQQYGQKSKESIEVRHGEKRKKVFNREWTPINANIAGYRGWKTVGSRCLN